MAESRISLECEEPEEPKPSQLDDSDDSKSENEKDKDEDKKDKIKKEERKEQNEKDLDQALEKVTIVSNDDKVDARSEKLKKKGKGIEEKFNMIKEKVTPTVLTSCKTNAFLKAFEVNHKLKTTAGKGGPEEERFKKLADEVEDFSVDLINQLSSFQVERNIQWWNHVVDEAIHRKQKKFISQPVIDNILQRRWYGSYFEKTKGWRFRLLLLWVLIESVVLPFLLFIFGTIELLSRCTARNGKKEEESKFVRYMIHFTTPYFIFVRDTLSYFGLLGLHVIICLSASTITFSGVEWLIFVFFLARLLMEVDQIFAAKEAERKRIENKSSWGVMGSRVQDKGNAMCRILKKHFRDQWNVLDLAIIVVYIVTFSLRMITWGVSVSVVDNRFLAVVFDFYGFIAMLLTLRVFGQVMEGMRGTGAIQIALVKILRDVVTIFWQFVAMVLAFSFVMSRIYASQRSYSPAANRTEEMTCNSAGLYCWGTIAKHLVWSVLGVSDWDISSSGDSVSESLVHLLYGLFLILGVILLVNMMIALLSNTYQSVQENSLREWSFKKALTIQTYDIYHPVPVPFNLVSILAVALYKRYKTNCGSDNESSSCDKGIKKRVERLMITVKKKYFKTYKMYGHSFPITGEEKIDRLLNETTETQKMVCQVMGQGFEQRGYREEKFRTGKKAWKPMGIQIDDNMLTYKGPDFCEECENIPKTNTWYKRSHGARYFTPFTREMPRMEVLIQDIGGKQVIRVGAVFEDYDHHEMPGLKKGSVGYQPGYGKIHDNSKKGRKVGVDALAYRGDLMACEVDFDNASEENRTIPVKFFLNCREVKQATMTYTSEREDVRPFPCIAFGSKGTRVLVKMCSSKAKRNHLNELPAAEEHSHTGMLEKQMGSIKNQMDSMENQIMELRGLLLQLGARKKSFV